MYKNALLFIGLLIVSLHANAQFIDDSDMTDDVHGDQSITGKSSIAEILSASGILGNIHIGLPDIASATHDPLYAIGVRILAASDISDPTPSLRWYTARLVNGSTRWVMDIDSSLITEIYDIFPITIASASFGVIATHPYLKDYMSIDKVIDVQLCGIQIPSEMCVPVSTISSATRNDAIRIYQRWSWFTPSTTPNKPRGAAIVRISYATP